MMEKSTMQLYLKIFKMKKSLFILLFFMGIANAQVMPFGMISSSAVTPGVPPAKIGDYRDGGVVFYVNPDDNTHGLVCSLTDINMNSLWYYDGYINTNAYGENIGSGETNTTKIIDAMNKNYNSPPLESTNVDGNTVYAAGIARNYKGGGYTDWFLPSKDELNQLFLNRVAVSNKLTTIQNAQSFPSVSVARYWTSSNFDLTYAWMQDLSSQFVKTKSTSGYLRAIRAF